ncbi:protein of unknown function (DUF1836) [Desulfosporosinus orientis DSM 765]|uniref:DUF1836 domain-containing protein n=1 Tax=Desulfosporosinus orientis (strain ATCC 19365 / DSM 765 / NCIMB 8382 / VKM B-1628 / Singapore I) TaxID=768706 RepID=G7W951_DESOD|nr:DUF1836 domain-containing protein [Desulfosporosinus orientis]AET68692.1 protein of unknown function (DUF1836) [Desulfosporosinus orientis DSM 765]
MALNEMDLKQLVDELSLTQDISLAEIPDIDLYMEQLTSFMDNRLGTHKRDEQDKILTKTMINNYTKAGLVMPPINKKYNQRHVILLILIYYLKNILSINDIKSLFEPVLNNISTPEDDLISLEDIYSTFLEVKNIELASFYENMIEKSNMIKEKTDLIDKDGKHTAELFLIVIMLVAQANAHKKLAEKIIDNYFSKEPS